MQEFDHPGGGCALLIVARSLTGDYDHRQPGLAHMNLLCHIQAAHAPHCQVGEYCVVSTLVQFPQGVFAAQGSDDDIPCAN
jgi:hypothetical protein